MPRVTTVRRDEAGMPIQATVRSDINLRVGEVREHYRHSDEGAIINSCELCRNRQYHDLSMVNRNTFENMFETISEDPNATIRIPTPSPVAFDEAMLASPTVNFFENLRTNVSGILKPKKKKDQGYCECCDTVVEAVQLMKTARDGLICKKCRRQWYRECIACQAIYRKGDFIGHMGQRWCRNCVMQIEALECRLCGQVAAINDTVQTADNFRICHECCQRDYIRCRRCELLWPKVKMFRCEPHNAWFCGQHRHPETCEGDSNGRHWTEKFSDGKQCTLLTNKRYMGVEIEAEMMPRRDRRGGLVPMRPNKFGLPLNFGIANDGSLRCGKEVNTPPASGTEHVKNVKIACHALKKAGYIVLPSCGLHVHIDLRDKVRDFTYLAHLLTTFYAVEDVLYATQPESRQKNHYCKWLRDDFKFFDFYGKQYVTDFDYKFYKLNKKRVSKSDFKEQKSAKYNNSRYYGINFHSIFFLGTLEIRMHAGSLNPIKIIRWCEIIQKIVNWVDTSYSYNKVLELLALPVNEQKLALFSKTFRLTPMLIKHIMARLVQFKNIGLRHRVTLGTIPQTYIKKLNRDDPKIRQLFAQIKENNKNLPSSQVSKESSERIYRDNPDGVALAVEPQATLQSARRLDPTPFVQVSGRRLQQLAPERST